MDLCGSKEGRGRHNNQATTTGVCRAASARGASRPRPRRRQQSTSILHVYPTTRRPRYADGKQASKKSQCNIKSKPVMRLRTTTQGGGQRGRRIGQGAAEVLYESETSRRPPTIVLRCRGRWAAAEPLTATLHVCEGGGSGVRVRTSSPVHPMLRSGASGRGAGSVVSQGREGTRRESGREEKGDHGSHYVDRFIIHQRRSNSHRLQPEPCSSWRPGLSPPAKFVSCVSSIKKRSTQQKPQQTPQQCVRVRGESSLERGAVHLKPIIGAVAAA